MGDNDVSIEIRNKLEAELNLFQFSVNNTFNIYNDCLDQYNRTLTKSLNENDKYFKTKKFQEIHKKAKTNSNAQVSISIMLKF